jgi:hypothetical protein
MFTTIQKIKYLEEYLHAEKQCYADRFKADVLAYFTDFKVGNPQLSFLKTLKTKNDIEDWVDNLTSRMVFMYDDELGTASDFIAQAVA